jgi:hypothetical protein
MRHGAQLLVLTLAISLAATPVAGEPVASGVGEPIEVAREFAATRAQQLGLDRLALEIGPATIRPHLSQRIVAFEVERQGWPVFFSNVVVQIGPDGDVRRVAAHLPGAQRAQGDHPGGCLDDALAWAAERQLQSSAPQGGWLETPGGELTPVVRLDVRAPDEQLPRSVYLDARSMRVVHVEPLVDHFDPPGAVYVENPVTTPEPVIVGLTHLDDLRWKRLNGLYAHVEQCVDVADCLETAPGAFPDNRGHFVFSPDLAEFAFHEPFAEVNAYHNISKINHWARESFGWNGEFDGNTWIWVKVGYAVYNAYFYQGNADIPPQITFGQDTVDFAYDADVAFHEFGHAINRSMWSHVWYFADRYGMDTSPFGIEEGFADIWAQTLAGDPVMNAYITRSRTADNDLVCPDDLRAEGHMEARILSGYGWDVRERVGSEAWEHAVYRTLPFLESQAAFDDLVYALIASAEDLDAEGEVPIPGDMTDALVEEAETRGLLDPDCLDRLVPLPEGEKKLVYGYGRDRTYGHDFPFGLQWKIEAPADAAALKLVFEWAYPDDEEPGYRVHLSRGKPVEVTWYPVSDLDESEPGFAVLADHTLNGAPVQVGYPFIGLDPLEPGEEVYVLLSGNMDARIVAIRVKAYSLQDLPPPPGRPLGGQLQQGPASASSWSPSCRAAATGAGGVAGTGLLAAIGAMFD